MRALDREMIHLETGRAEPWNGGACPDGYWRSPLVDELRALCVRGAELARQARSDRDDVLDFLRACHYDTAEARIAAARADALTRQLEEVERCARSLAMIAARSDAQTHTLRTSGSQAGDPPERGTPIAEPDRHSGDASQGARAQPRARRAHTPRSADR